MKRIGLGKISQLALAAALSIAGVASNGCDKPSDAGLSSRDIGAVGFKLSMPGGVSIDNIKYTITGPGSYTKTGTIPVGGSGTTFSAKLDGIPVGSGYVMTLDATTSDGGIKCVGTSPSFEIAKGAVSSVAVRLLCPGKPGGSTGDSGGSVMINGTIDICAVVESAVASASTDGKSFSLKGVASDADNGPGALGYKWSASAGTLTAIDATNVTLNCPANGGNVDIVFEVTDTVCGDKLKLDTVVCGKGDCDTSGSGGNCGSGGKSGSGTGGTVAGMGAAGGGTGGTVAGMGAAGLGVAGMGTAGMGTAGMGTAGMGAAGLGVAGMGAAGMGAAGMGAAGMTGTSCAAADACCNCERVLPHMSNGKVSTNCSGSISRCETMEGTLAAGPLMGMAKNEVCKQIVKCMHEKHCAKAGAPTDCLCGADADPDVCFNMSSFAQVTGPCKDLIAGGGESTMMTDLQTRFFDADFPAGRAETVIETCDLFFCSEECL